MVHLAVILLLAPVQDVPDLHETVRDSLAGGFTVEHEKWVRRGIPIMHAPSAWQKVRLRWTSADGRLSFYYEDKGRVLSFGSDLKPAGVGNPCSSYGGAYAYGDTPGTAARWQSGYPAMIAQMSQVCPHADPATMARYRSEFETAAGRFPAASVRFRAVATRVFGQVARRCVDFDSAPLFDPYSEPACTRWSGPKQP